MLFLVMLRCIRVPFSSPQRVILCGYITAFHAFGSKFIYEKHTAPMQGSAGASLCQFAWRSLFRAGLLTQAVYVCRAFPNRFSGICSRLVLYSGASVRGFHPASLLAAHLRAEHGTCLFFSLTLSPHPSFVNLYQPFWALVFFTNRKVDRLELHLVFMLVLLRKLWDVRSGMGGWNGKEDAWCGRGNNRVSLGREIWGEGTAEKREHK